MNYSGDQINPLPNEIREYYKKSWEINQKEKKRISSLSKSERTEKIIDDIKQLSKYGGFSMVGFQKVLK